MKPLEPTDSHHLKAAEGCLKKAMAIDKRSVKRVAMDDPDLKPFWDSLGGALQNVTD